MSETIVQAIALGKEPGCVIYQSEQVIAFMDIEPIHMGHILICPVKHIKTFDQLPEVVLNEINLVARKCYQLIQSKLNPDGISMMSNNGYCNELDHYHLHVFPRFQQDGFDWVCPSSKLKTQEELQKFIQDNQFYLA